MKTFLKKYLYFHRNETYCIIINNDIKDIFSLKAVLIKAFLTKFFKLQAKVRFKIFFCMGAPPPHVPLVLYSLIGSITFPKELMILIL